MKRWTPYHFVIPLTEGEIPMDKGGFRTVTDKSWSSALEAVVYCKDCKFAVYNKKTGKCECQNGTTMIHDPKWFCADGEKRQEDG